MTHNEKRRLKAIKNLKKNRLVNKETIDAEYVNSTTVISISCDGCGTTIKVLPSNLLKRGVVNCTPCKYIKIGQANTKWEAPAWFQQRFSSIKNRIKDTRNKSYKNYGGRGITLEFRTVDDMWFYVKTLPNYSVSLTIDRVNNNGNYEKGNLRWADSLTQNNNTRRNSCNVRRVNGSPNYQARITKYGKAVYLGTFKTKSSAISAVKKANEDKKNEYRLG